MLCVPFLLGILFASCDAHIPEENAPITNTDYTSNQDTETQGTYLEKVIKRGTNYLIDSEGAKDGFDDIYRPKELNSRTPTKQESKPPIVFHSHGYKPNYHQHGTTPKQGQTPQYPPAIQYVVPQYQPGQYKVPTLTPTSGRTNNPVQPMLLPYGYSPQYVGMPQNVPQMMPYRYVLRPAVVPYNTGVPSQNLIYQGQQVVPVGVAPVNPGYLQQAVGANAHQPQMSNMQPYLMNTNPYVPNTQPILANQQALLPSPQYQSYGGMATGLYRAPTNYHQQQVNHQQAPSRENDQYGTEARKELARLVNPNSNGFNIEIRK